MIKTTVIYADGRRERREFLSFLLLNQYYNRSPYVKRIKIRGKVRGQYANS